MAVWSCRYGTYTAVGCAPDIEYLLLAGGDSDSCPPKNFLHTTYRRLLSVTRQVCLMQSLQPWLVIHSLLRIQVSSSLCNSDS